MYAKVLTEIGAKNDDKTFLYRIPSNLESSVSKGKRVKIPFGNRYLEGFVIDITSSLEENIKVKDILEVIDEKAILNEELLLLGKYIADKTLCSLITAYQTMLPKALKANIKINMKPIKEKYLLLNKNKDIDSYLKNCPYKSQVEILNKLKEEKEVKIDNLTSSINTLIKKDLIYLEYRDKYRYEYNKNTLDKKVTLNEEQENAVNIVSNNFNSAITYLLYGVTGSGKTEVYLSLIEKVINNGKSAIMLVPEISLTPQIISRFKARFGDDVAVLHSALSDGERYDEYRKIMEDKVHIVVGARSAIFAPLKNIGIIIIDEEHVQTYKQDTSPRYHARDVAIWRSNYYKCPLILGSATPSLESYARALKNIYYLLELKQRANKKDLPNITVVDMKKEYAKKNMIFSDALKKNINKCLDLKEQVILLLNRRGYSSIITCKDCGHVFKCPNCDISLTYHKTSNILRCHYCGYATNFPSNCPNCKQKNLKDFGLGTERLEEEINHLFPQARVVRMDLDTTSKKGGHEKIIDDFANYKYDILVGTQMIAKGLDFPLVTLVGVINADMSLNIPDFRSSERTFQLLCQVSGRAGRASKEGNVIVQAINNEHYSIKHAMKHDYLGFYQEEMNIRKILKYSPYYYITLIKIMAKDYTKGMNEAIKIASYLKKELSKETIVLGPSPANVLKINNIYNFQCIIKYRKDDNLIKTLKFIDNKYIIEKDINISIDQDPLRL